MRRGLPLLLLSLLFLLLQTLPFVLAQNAADPQHQFAGFLLNPIDGFSYLAKMRQGFDGAWSFTLPYTATAGEGAAINLYYLLLGHFARLAGWGLAFTFSIARIAGAVALCAALYRLFARTLPESQRTWAFGLTLFGSGLGWLAILFGGFTSDFWVAEAYPFLASFANAHFPLGLALQIFLLTPTRTPRPVAWALAAVALSLIYPFGWAVAAVVLVGVAALTQAWGLGERSRWQQAACVLLAGLPYAAYALWAVNTHPVLSGWNAQNITPAMPVWDLVLSFAPALLLALAGAYMVWKQRRVSLAVFFAWLLVCLVLLYLPFGLQRRLVSGLYVPVMALAVFAAAQLFSAARLRLALIGLVLLALPTNLFLLLGAAQAAQAQDAALYLESDELATYHWLDEHAPAGALVLAPARNSLHLPAFADVRVWYGHPFETVQAEQRQVEQDAFFADPSARQRFLDSTDVSFVLFDLSELPAFALPGWVTVFSQGSVEVLAPHGD